MRFGRCRRRVGLRRAPKTRRRRRTIEANDTDEAGDLVKTLNTMTLNLNPATNVTEANYQR
jgi:hypothetical protein